MKRSKWWSGWLVALCLGAWGVPEGWAETEIVDGIEWAYTVSDTGVSVGNVGWSRWYGTFGGTTAVHQAATGPIAIPSMLGGQPVTSIGQGAFQQCTNLTSVTIPEGVTDIGKGAFYGCIGLTSVSVPASVTNIAWSSVEPSLLPPLGYPAFEGCTGLTNILVAAGNPSYSSMDGVLFTHDGNTLLICPAGKTGAYSVPDGVTEVGNYHIYGETMEGLMAWGGEAFSGCTKLTSVTIPDSVTNIGENAFYGCSGLTTVWIGAGVREIETFCVPFSGCNSLQEIHVAPENATYASIDGVLLSKDAQVLYICPAGRTGTYSVPDSVTVIGGWTMGGIGVSFDGCSGLTSMTIPVSVTNIVWHALSGCSGLMKLYVPSEWEGTSMLESAGLPEACKVVYGMEWEYSIADGKATVTGGGPFVGDVAIPSELGGCPVTDIGNCTVWLEGEDWIGGDENIFSGCTKLTSVTIPGSVTNIAFPPFKGCSGLTEIRVATDNPVYSSQDGVLFSKDGKTLLFCPCAKKGTYSFSEGATKIGTGKYSGEYFPWACGEWKAFSGCTNLTSVTIPGSVETIMEEAFSGCSSLTDIHVAAGSASYASQNGVLLTKDEKTLLLCPAGKTGVFAIPDGVTTIGNYHGDWHSNGDYYGGGWKAFCDCSKLTSVTIPDSVTTIGVKAFNGCIGLKSATIPSNVTDIGDYAFVDCKGLTALTILSVSARIGNDWGGVFSGCGGLRSVTIEGGSIGKRAFVGCTNLTSVRLGDGVTGIGHAAFLGCSGLKTLYVPAEWERTSMLDDAEVPAECTVVYGEAPESVLRLGEANRTFAAAAANYKELEVTADVRWTVTSSVSWLALRTEGGTGNGTIVYDVAVNTGTDSRTGTITVTGGGLVRVFTVTQDGVSGTQDTPVEVPFRWLEEKAAGILAANGGDYEAAAKATAANGRAVWECYVAGVSATVAGENFTAVLVQEDGKWVAKPDPDLGDARGYVVEGSPSIGEGASWGPPTEDSRFFRVGVGMKKEE